MIRVTYEITIAICSLDYLSIKQSITKNYKTNYQTLRITIVLKLYSKVEDYPKYSKVRIYTQKYIEPSVSESNIIETINRTPLAMLVNSHSTGNPGSTVELIPV